VRQELAESLAEASDMLGGHKHFDFGDKDNHRWSCT
jgi:hypothetical protein